MSVNNELALAANRVRVLTEQLPADVRPDVAAEWSSLLRELDLMRSDGAMQLAVIQWREDYEARIRTIERENNNDRATSAAH